MIIKFALTIKSSTIGFFSVVLLQFRKQPPLQLWKLLV